VSGGAREVLEREVSGKAPPPPVAVKPVAPRVSPTAAVRRGERRERHGERGASAERELVRAMLASRSKVEQIAEKLGEESFRDPQYRAIYHALVASGPESSIEEVSASLDEEGIGLLEDIIAEGSYQMDAERTINDSLATLIARDLDQRAAEIDRIIPLADGEQKDKLIAEKEAIRLELNATGKKYYKKFRRTEAR
jgi:replicative DNA helicase